MTSDDNSILNLENPAECTIVGRLNRFVVQVKIADKPYLASINNTGRLLEFLVPGRRAYCLPHTKPLKTDFQLFAIEEGGLGALIDTRLQMNAFEQALETGMIPWLDGFHQVRRDAPLGRSLIDYLLTDGRHEVYLEVKSAALREGEYAMYPDCPTTRGRKHIRELTEHRRKSGTACILFMAALPDVRAFKPNRPADPELYQLLLKAKRAGVELKALNIAYNPQRSAILLLNPDLTVEI